MQTHRLIPSIAMLAAAMLLAGCDREPAAWEAATAANTIRSYEQYLADHADGAHAAEANSAERRVYPGISWRSSCRTRRRIPR